MAQFYWRWGGRARARICGTKSQTSLPWLGPLQELFRPWISFQFHPFGFQWIHVLTFGVYKFFKSSHNSLFWASCWCLQFDLCEIESWRFIWFSLIECSSHSWFLLIKDQRKVKCHWIEGQRKFGFEWIKDQRKMNCHSHAEVASTQWL